MPVTIKKLANEIGAEAIGLDLSKPIDNETFARVAQAFYQHTVLVVRDHEFNDDDHIRFSARFGELKRLTAKHFLHKDHPEIFVISNIKKDGEYIGIHDAGVFWHSDGPFLDKPHGPAALHAIQVPTKDGKALGDTSFSSTIAAYDALPALMKKKLEGLRAVHSLSRRHTLAVDKGIDSTVLTQGTVDTMATHDLIRVHPHSGRKCLYITEGYTTEIIGMPENESKELISFLTQHCTKPEFQYVHSWRTHDLVMWDNISAQHKASFDYDPLPRLMHRTTLVNP